MREIRREIINLAQVSLVIHGNRLTKSRSFSQLSARSRKDSCFMQQSTKNDQAGIIQSVKLA